MSTPQYWLVALPTPLKKHFTYAYSGDDLLQPFMRVRVPFGRRELIGFLIEPTTLPEDLNPEKIKDISTCLDEAPFWPNDLIALFQFTASYYHHPIGEVCLTGLPKKLRQGDLLPTPKKISPPCEVVPHPLPLNPEQEAVIAGVGEHLGGFHAGLLEGVTGSGKTQIYLQLAAQCHQANQSVLVLVPEIGLTPQLIYRFEQHFSQVFQYHSQLSEGERLRTYWHAKRAEPSIIIGTRSALFLPMHQLGLIIVDEEHDAAYKQQDGCRFHARDLAIKRAALVDCPILLGSATPSLESLIAAQDGRYHWYRLQARAQSQAQTPITCLDMRHYPMAKRGLSDPLVKHMRAHLDRGEQVLLFLNRRGFSPIWMCFECGDVVQCKACEKSLTYHQGRARLQCHHCLKQYALDSHRRCHSCQSEMMPFGWGTEQLAQVVGELCPNYPVIRVDTDTTQKKQAFQQMREQIQSQAPCVIVGTQMLAKGHDFPNVTLVAIVDTDSGLFAQDFRATERLAQLVTQVSGRAGRAHLPGQTFLQTCHPEHPLIQQLSREDYHDIALNLLQERQSAQLPPFQAMAMLRVQSRHSQETEAYLQRCCQFIQTQASDTQCIGPLPALQAKKAHFYRFQLLILSANRRLRYHALYWADTFLEQNPPPKGLQWRWDIDPIDLY